MLKVEVVVDDGQFERTKKQIREAAAKALTATARAVKEAMPAAMERTLDRPTPFTKKGLYVSGATPERLTAEVGFMDIQARYMKYQIAGGTRASGSRGIRLPGNITLDPFGNIPKGMTDKLKAAAQSGDLSKAITQRLGVGKRRKGDAPIQLFYGRPTGSRWSRAPMGIWRRVPGRPGKLIPVIVFEDKPALYRSRFDFEREAAAVVQSEWDRQFDAALAQAMGAA